MWKKFKREITIITISTPFTAIIGLPHCNGKSSFLTRPDGCNHDFNRPAAGIQTSPPACIKMSLNIALTMKLP
jgi:hypothetical protein